MTRDELLKKICPLGTCDCGDDYESCNCDDCNRVLEEWLDEYDKQIRAEAINDYDNKLNEKINTDTRLKDTIRKILDNVAREMYCKGIDELVQKVKKHQYVLSDIFNNKDHGMFTIEIEQIAEKLKKGENNV